VRNFCFGIVVLQRFVNYDFWIQYQNKNHPVGGIDIDDAVLVSIAHNPFCIIP
jgi:hypothetical protein